MVPRADRKLLAQLSRGSLAYCLLALLREDARSGAELMRSLAAADGLVTSQETVSTLLTRLRVDGLVETKGRKPTEDPSGWSYRITDPGRDRLRGFIVQWRRFRDTVDGLLDTAERPAVAPTVWLTGLPGAGKTTLARSLQRELSKSGVGAYVLDGDDIRAGLSSDLGLSREDRGEQCRRVAHVAAIVSSTGTAAIVALVSPYGDDRRQARAIHAAAGIPFIEVWVDTPTEVCRARDPKGLYACAAAGQLIGLTGHDAPYQPPDPPDLRISGCDEPADASASQIAQHALAKVFSTV